FVGTGPTYSATDFGDYYVEATNEFGCVSNSKVVSIGECCPIDSCDVYVPSICPALGHDFDVAITETTCNEKIYEVTDPDYLPGSARWLIYNISDGVIFSGNGDQINYTFDLPGYYKIVLIAKLDGFNYPDPSCAHTFLFLDSVRMVADYVTQTACVNESVDFNDLTTFIPGESITNWEWDFDDPSSGASNSSNDQNPSHTFASSGDYNVKLTTTSTNGCTSTIEQVLKVSDGPPLSISYDSINCEASAVAFSLTGSEFEIQWDFDDPSSNENTATETEVLHTFDNAGLYNVSVSAEDVYGCSNSATVTVDVRANNLAGDIDIVPGSELCEGDTATLTAPSGGMEWLWSNDEATESIKVTTSDQYSVFIKDENNCSYTTPAEFILVHPKSIVLLYLQ
ncbi:MAG: PKD domain-containing protein, partial [Bacteroidota bacterium]